MDKQSDKLLDEQIDFVIVFSIKAVFHCSRFARAGGANMFQLLLSNVSIFCLLLCARTRLEVELHLPFLACPRD